MTPEASPPRSLASHSDRPWMTALEMQFAALRACDAADGQPWATVAHGVNIVTTRRILRQADAYAWSKESAQAVMMASRTVPLDTTLVLDTLPSKCGWWWFGDSLHDTNVRAIAWGISDDGFVEFICFDYLSTDIKIPGETVTFCWKIGTSLETLIEHIIPARELSEHELSESRAVLGGVARFFLAAISWLNQRVVSMSYGHIERHRRKQLAREHNAPIQSDVKVIELRRAESPSHQSSTDSEAVEWSCRWIVGGHWRNQPYKDERKLIYIMPYVKGPEDKPLKVPTHTVYQVSR